MCGLDFLNVDLGYFRHGLLAKLVTFLYFVSNSFPIIRNKRRQLPWPTFLQEGNRSRPSALNGYGFL